jgi:hypothetical protein
MILFISQNRLSHYGNGKTYLDFLPENYRGRYCFVSFDDSFLGKPKVYYDYCDGFDSITVKKIGYFSIFSKIGLKSIFRDYRLVLFIFNFLRVRSIYYALNRNIDSVFFVGGDNISAHYLYAKFKSRKSIYFTDNYYKKYPFFISDIVISLFIKNNVKLSDRLFVISSFMKEYFLENFYKEGLILHRPLNLRSRYVNNTLLIDKFEMGEKIKFIYSGGLHANRILTLVLFAIHMKKEKMNFEIILLTHEFGFLRQFFKRFSIIHEGFVDFQVLKQKVDDSDCILVLETFFPFVFNSSKYSFSTKISEVTSMNKFVIAVGSLKVSTINFLTCYGFAINFDPFGCSGNLYSHSSILDIFSALPDEVVIDSLENKNYKYFNKLEQ